MGKQAELLFSTRLNTCYNNLTTAEIQIADYMKKHIDEVGNLSAKQLAELTETSTATVVRFCKSCGFSGLPELKMSLKHEVMDQASLKDIDIYPKDSVAVIKQKVLNYHCAVISSMTSVWDEKLLEQAANALLGAKKVIATGAGTSRTMALMFYDCCNKLNIPCFFSSDLVDEVTQIGMLDKGDVLVGFTYTGRFRSTVENMKLARERGATTIGILGIAGSPATKYLDIPLYTSAPNREYYFGAQNNMIGDFAIIEILYTILATRKGIQSAYEENRYKSIQRHRLD